MSSNNSNILIQRSLEYYDKNYELNMDFFKNIYKRDIVRKSNNDMERDIIKFYDKNNKLLRAYKYEVIGIYKETDHLWQWAWANSELEKNKNYLSRKILNYGLDLDPTQSFLKTELITSTFRLTTNIQLDIHIALASYLSKIPLVYKYDTTITGEKNNEEKKEIIYIFLIERI
jgi:hypothetical protein